MVPKWLTELPNFFLVGSLNYYPVELSNPSWEWRHDAMLEI